MTDEADQKLKAHQKLKAKAKQQTTGFIGFVREQGVVGLAIGFIVGTQAKVLVDALTNGFINPMVGLILPGGGSLAGRTFTITVGSQEAVFGWGLFVYTLIDFIIIAGVIYFVFKWLRLDKLDKKS